MYQEQTNKRGFPNLSQFEADLEIPFKICLLRYNRLLSLRLFQQVSHLSQSADCLVKCTCLSCEMQTDQVVDILSEEAGTWNCSNADVADHPFAEFQISVAFELWQSQEVTDIDRDEVGSLRYVVFPFFLACFYMFYFSFYFYC